jgi:prophage regulatory protein
MNVRPTKLKIERQQDVLDKIRISRSTLYLRIQQGLFVPPISLGRRSVGWLEHETDLILRAFISGKDELEIKKLVQEVVESRAELSFKEPSKSRELEQPFQAEVSQ